jgi:ribosomal protein L37AE/L43A
MTERSLRGSRLGAVSYESDKDVTVVERQHASYRCPRGHKFSVTFAADITAPSTWSCTDCGSQALAVGGAQPEDIDRKPKRTHWDMLRERRSIPDLEELLSERLMLLRGSSRHRRSA